MFLSLRFSFFLVRMGELLTSMSTRLLMAGLSWYFIAINDSAPYAALLFSVYYAAKCLCRLLLSPLGDRCNKKRLVLASPFIIMLTSSLMLIAFNAGYHGLLFACVGLIALGESYLAGLVNAMIPELVPKPFIENAYRHSFMLQSLSNILGIALGIAAVEVLSTSYMFAVALVIAFGAWMCFGLMRYNAASGVALNKGQKKRQYIKEIAEGVALSYTYKTEYYWNLISSFATWPLPRLFP